MRSVVIAESMLQDLDAQEALDSGDELLAACISPQGGSSPRQGPRRSSCSGHYAAGSDSRRSSLCSTRPATVAAASATAGSDGADAAAVALALADSGEGPAGAPDQDRAGQGAAGNGPVTDVRYMRRLYPAGRILHILPQPPADDPAVHPASQPPTAPAAPAAGGIGAVATAAGSAPGSPQQLQHMQRCPSPAPSPMPPPAIGSSSSGRYMVVEVGSAAVYGRVRLCRTMLVDHTAPAYLRAVDALLGQMALALPLDGQQAGEG